MIELRATKQFKITFSFSLFRHQFKVRQVSKMGFQDVQVLRSTLNYGNGDELTQEMQERCREVASELRSIGDTLEAGYSRKSGMQRSIRIIIGATLLGIVTNIVLRYFA